MNAVRYLIPVIIGVSLFILILSFILYLTGLFTSDIHVSALLGIGIPLMNFILGYISIVFSLKQSHSLFLIIFLGGMIIRLFLMLIAVFLVLKFLENIAYSFIFIIFIFYSIYLITEILYLNQLKNR